MANTKKLPKAKMAPIRVISSRLTPCSQGLNIGMIQVIVYHGSSMKVNQAFKKNTAIIVPVYNEGQVIESVIKHALKTFDVVVCVNDGSKDNSSDQIKKTRAYLVEHPINMGQGAALQTGIDFAKMLPNIDNFVMFDADGQHRVEDVLTMLKELASEKYDIILGSRFLGSTVGMKKSKKMLLKMAIKFSNATSGVKLTDTHNGLRVFNRHVAETMQITMPDMSHASEILEIISKNNYRYTEVPVTIEYTDYSRSKGQAMINAINIVFDTLLRKISK